MKTLALALVLLHTGCATVASETRPSADPSSASQGNGPSAPELSLPSQSPGAANETEPTFAVVGGQLMMTEPGASARALWPVAEAPVLFTRFVSHGERGYAVVLRQRDAILVGSLDRDHRPMGDLARIEARHVIGAPAVAASGDVAMVTWAQGESSGCTSLVAAVFALGERPGPAQRIRGSECNEDHSARAPTLSSAAEGGFVLAFTEIGVWSSQSVALVLSDEARPPRFVGARASVR